METKSLLRVAFIRDGRHLSIEPVSIRKATNLVNLGPFRLSEEEVAFQVLFGDGVWDLYGNQRVTVELI